MTCDRCGDKGLIRVLYQSGEPFDIAICQCRVGQIFRRGGEDLIRASLQVGPEHQVALLEDFEGEELKPAEIGDDFLAAGKARKAKR